MKPIWPCPVVEADWDDMPAMDASGRFLWQEKKDGQRAIVHLGATSFKTGWRVTKSGQPIAESLDMPCPRGAGWVLDCEQMKDGTFWVFDCLVAGGRDIRGLALATRLDISSRAMVVPPTQQMQFLPFYDNALDIEQVGIEGIVAKDKSEKYSAYATWHKFKFTRTWDVQVLDIQRDIDSATIALVSGGKLVECGRIAYLPKHVQEGDIIEISAFERLPSGKFRNAKYVRTRTDKQKPNASDVHG